MLAQFRQVKRQCGDDIWKQDEWRLLRTAQVEESPIDMAG